MIPLIGVKLPKGDAILLTATIGGATTSLADPNQTDVYTDTFPTGLTIDMPLRNFYDLWYSSLVTEMEYVEDDGNVH